MDEPETARIKSTDMSESMQSIAVDCCAAACERFKEERDIAKYIKNEFDKRYGGTWQCVVGKNFVMLHIKKIISYIFICI
ncbi:Dynein light chain 1, cytoplasmic [Schistosoma japonicum]|nr:Dynein light chain 1, cytoplasmic [Schistosoma japonicum]